MYENTVQTLIHSLAENTFLDAYFPPWIKLY